MRTTRGLVAGCVLASALLTLGGAATAVAQSNKDKSRRTTMADAHTLIDRNLEFANSFNQGDLTLFWDLTPRARSPYR